MIKSVAHSLYLFTLLLVLTACGGGGSVERNPQGGGNGGSGETPAQPTVVLSLSAQDGTASSELATGAPLVVTATVADGDNNPIEGTVVTFSLSNADLAAFDQDVPTARTNEEGIATITMIVGSASGAGEVTGSISVGDADAVEGSASFTSLGSTITPNTIVVTLSIQQADGMPGNTVREDTPLEISAQVTDSNLVPLVDELVTFTLAPPNLAVFDNSTGTALTDANGIAVIGLLVGDESGSGQVTATLDSGETDDIGFVSEGTVASVDVPADLRVVASELQLSSSGNDSILLRAIVKNAQNILLQGIPVEFSANADAALSNVQPITNEFGEATAELTTGSNPDNREITVSASIINSGLDPAVLPIDVVGTALSIVGPSSIIVFDSVELEVLLEDSDNNGISRGLIDLTVRQGDNIVTEQFITGNSRLETDTNGRASFVLNAATSGAYTVNATLVPSTEVSETTLINFPIVVQEDQFSFTEVPADSIPVVNFETTDDGFEPVTVTWLREGNPVDGRTVTLASSRGEIQSASVVTNADGEATFNIRSNNAGEARLVATAEDDGVSVTARNDVFFNAEVPDTIIVDADPDAIGPDNLQSNISAVVRDELGNRVADQTVSFSVFDTSGGSLAPPQALTDRRGIATTVYSSNAISSNESVVITASIGDVSGEASLTVGDRGLDISIGTGREIQSLSQSAYRKEFSVFVLDPDGNPVRNEEIFLSITPLRASEGSTYSLGTWRFDNDSQLYVEVNYHIDPATGDFFFDDVDDNGERDADEPLIEFDSFGCPNEDVNFDGILDIRTEDTNGDGDLTPGLVAVIDEVIVTDDDGRAVAFVDYPKQFGNWVTTRVTARGGSAGSESSDSMIFRLGVALEDINVEGSPPPSSPYGIGNDCSVSP